MANTDSSNSVDSNLQRHFHETPSRMNNKAEPTGFMNDTAQLDFVREWISVNYGDMVGHSGASYFACKDKESLQFSAYHRNKPFRRYESMDRSSRGSTMDTYHGELLRKLEHLKMEISRTYEVPEKAGKLMFFPEDRVMYNSRPRPFAQLSPTEQHLYPKTHFGQFPYTAGIRDDMQDSYSHPGYSPCYPLPYQDSLKLQMRRPSHQFTSNPVMESPIREEMRFGEDLFATYTCDTFPHPPTCSCLSCSHKYHPHFHTPIHQTTVGIGGTPKSPSTFGSYHRTDSVPMWPPYGEISVVSPAVQSHHSRLPGSRPNDFNLNMDNLRPRRNSVSVNQGIKKYCHPLAGGAPFTTCPKCRELLKLPHVFTVKRLSVYNLKCGSCFSMFQVDLGNRKRDTFLTREFPLPDGMGSNEAVDERNSGPRRHSMADGTICDKSNVSEACPASADNPDLEFQQEKSDLCEKSESRELSARSSSITSVSSEDPMLSNVVLRGRILRDVYKLEKSTEDKKMNAQVDLCSKSLSASSLHEQHMPSDMISRRIVEEDSVQKNHENKDMHSDGGRFAVHYVSSEEQKLSNEIVGHGIPEEGTLRMDPIGKELNGGVDVDLNSQILAASSVSSEKQDLSSHVIIGRIPHEESQQNYPMVIQDSSEIMGKKSEPFAASFNFSEKLNASFDVITGLGVTNAAMEPSLDVMARVEVAERDPKSSQKESVLNENVTEPEVAFSFISRLSSNEYTDDVSSSDHHSKLNIGKRSESSLVSFVGKGLNDFSRQQDEDDEMTNVTVNGHPMTKEDLERAEILAGRVLPGHYWYDYFGGFWGVMGEPCLGIIPPFIEEFNYPLRANCAAGNTDVFVNGRELHQIDLELLATRGLPTARNRSYKITICGTVYDERTGEELKSLGLLAPTVIKAKRGFGMRVPRNMNST